MGSILGLQEPYKPELTQSQREAKLRDASRAERLLDYPEMKWWLDEHVGEEEKRQFNRLLKAENEKQADEARGSIKALRGITQRLQFMASQRSKLEEQLND